MHLCEPICKASRCTGWFKKFQRNCAGMWGDLTRNLLSFTGLDSGVTRPTQSQCKRSTSRENWQSGDYESHQKGMHFSTSPLWWWLPYYWSQMSVSMAIKTRTSLLTWPKTCNLRLFPQSLLLLITNQRIRSLIIPFTLLKYMNGGNRYFSNVLKWLCISWHFKWNDSHRIWQLQLG